MAAVPVALTVAGSDPSGGAGIQADLKTFHQHGVYGASVVSLLTVQNTREVSRVEVLDPSLVREQLLAVLDDLPVAAIKTGALGSAEIVRAVAQCLADRGLPLVIDPVRIAKHGAALLGDEAREVMLEELVPGCALLTPNRDEAAWLSGQAVDDVRHARRAAEALLRRGASAVLLKGGHLPGDEVVDLLCTDDEVFELSAPRLHVGDTHGLGCTLSAAITARMARGEALADACREATAWLRRTMQSAPGLGGGVGPVNHLAK
ncbi:MAG: bifunctional hydroxymethylpyrimidine kinase/phosphomethylpyrimidine kinase [Myxococcales bacterium]|jgi:hydroxymethylpyrimidine/phosphomethylpyrimidine kinase